MTDAEKHFVKKILENVLEGFLAAWFLPIILSMTIGFGLSLTEMIIETFFPFINDIKNIFENYFIVFLESTFGFFAIWIGVVVLNTLDDLGYSNIKTLARKVCIKISAVF